MTRRALGLVGMLAMLLLAKMAGAVEVGESVPFPRGFVSHSLDVPTDLLAHAGLALRRRREAAR